ncbi:MAG: hypothetical protein HQL32_15220 [Planctomycetes bacterium]|nr:hypothetical protein [Planctomycetota bacterium]
MIQSLHSSLSIIIACLCTILHTAVAHPADELSYQNIEVEIDQKGIHINYNLHFGDKLTNRLLKPAKIEPPALLVGEDLENLIKSITGGIPLIDITMGDICLYYGKSRIQSEWLHARKISKTHMADAGKNLFEWVDKDPRKRHYLFKDPNNQQKETIVRLPVEESVANTTMSYFKGANDVDLLKLTVASHTSWYEKYDLDKGICFSVDTNLKTLLSGSIFSVKCSDNSLDFISDTLTQQAKPFVPADIFISTSPTLKKVRRSLVYCYPKKEKSDIKKTE